MASRNITKQYVDERIKNKANKSLRVKPFSSTGPHDEESDGGLLSVSFYYTIYCKITHHFHCIHTYIYTFICTYIHTNIFIYSHTFINIHMNYSQPHSHQVMQLNGKH